MNMTSLRLIRGSEVGTFLSDRWSWKRRWVDHLVKKTPDGKLFFGDLFHKYLELYYRLETDVDEKVHDWIQTKNLEGMDPVVYQDLIELFHKVSGHYMTTYAPVDEFDILATELKFAIPLYEDDPLDLLQGTLDFAYEGTIDLLYLEDGKLKFMDHKTTTSIDRYVANSILDRQISRYWWALTALCQGHGYVWHEVEDTSGEGVASGWVPVKNTHLYQVLSQFSGPEEFVYNIIRKDAPKKPELLKKGGLSKNKAQNTTYALYKQAIADYGLAEADYLDILEHFELQGDKFLRRISVERSESECQAAMEDFTKVCREIMSLRHELEVDPVTAESRLYYNITWDTPTFNSYFPLIEAEIKGDNVSMVQAMLYETEKDWNPEDDFIEVEEN
jgi:hypothetical protein